jgi:hypothetical protein
VSRIFFEQAREGARKVIAVDFICSCGLFSLGPASLVAADSAGVLAGAGIQKNNANKIGPPLSLQQSGHQELSHSIQILQ